MRKVNNGYLECCHSHSIVSNHILMLTPPCLLVFKN